VGASHEISRPPDNKAIAPKNYKIDSSLIFQSMDHLLTPPGAEPIRIPYRCTHPYDRGSFDEYPERRGWTHEHIFGDDGFAGRTEREVESFFQSWLYFGTLHSILAIGGVNIAEEDFVARDIAEPLVTTKRLPEMIAAWKECCKTRSDLGSTCPAWVATKEILDRLINFLDLFGEIRCPRSGSDSTIIISSKQIIERPFSEEISMSIIALGFTLSQAAVDIYKIEWNNYNKYVNYTSTLLRKKLEEMGWCISDIGRLFTELGIDAHYYVALQKPPEPAQSHSNCRDRQCLAATVDETNYCTRHVEGCKGEDDLNRLKIGSLVKEVVKVIDNNGIPVVSWEAVGKDTPEMRVQDALANRVEYVAISHM